LRAGGAGLRRALLGRDVGYATGRSADGGGKQQNESCGPGHGHYSRVDRDLAARA
jgi:hypothetical protein